MMMKRMKVMMKRVLIFLASGRRVGGVDYGLFGENGKQDVSWGKRDFVEVIGLWAIIQH